MKSALATALISVLAFTSASAQVVPENNSTIVGSDSNSTVGVVPVFTNVTAVDSNSTTSSNSTITPVTSTNTTVPVNSTSDSNSTTPIIGGNTTTPVNSTTPVVGGNNSTSPVIGGDNSTTPVVGGNNSTDNSTSPVGDDNSTTPVVGGDNSTTPVGNNSGSDNGTDGSGSTTPPDGTVVVLPVADLINCGTSNQTACALVFGTEFCCASASGVLSTDATNTISPSFCYNQTQLLAQRNDTYQYGNYDLTSFACLSGNYIQMTGAAIVIAATSLLF
jgi:opacity protein-like surface antigen